MTFIQLIDESNSKTMCWIEGDFRSDELKTIVKNVKALKGDSRDLRDLMAEIELHGFTAKFIPVTRVEF